MGVKDKGLSYLLIRKKPVMLLIQLARSQKMMYTSVLAKEINCTYSHTVKMLSELRRKKIVNFERKGRLKFVKLTRKGKELAEALERLMSIINKIDY